MKQFEIQIQDLRVHARIGTTDEEQTLGQSLLVHLVLRVRAPLRSDSLGETVDYGEIVQCVRNFSDCVGRVKLVESFVSGLIDTLMEHFAQVCAVSARVQKSYVPVKDFTGRISIEMHSSRD